MKPPISTFWLIFFSLFIMMSVLVGFKKGLDGAINEGYSILEGEEILQEGRRNGGLKLVCGDLKEIIM